MGIGTAISLDRRIENAETDGEDILYRLTQKGFGEGEIDIVADLPASIDTELIIASVCRWTDLQRRLDGHNLRVFALSYNTAVEKYVLNCTQNMQHVFVTPVPML